MVIFTGALVFVTSIYTFYSYQLWQITKRQLEVSEKVFRASNAATLDAAIKKGPATAGATWAFQINVRNTGRLSARNISDSFGHQFVPEHTRPDFELPPLRWTEGELTPNGSIVWDWVLPEREVSESQKTQVEGGSLGLYLFGVYWYDNGFTRTCHEYCVRFAEGFLYKCLFSSGGCAMTINEDWALSRETPDYRSSGGGSRSLDAGSSSRKSGSGH